MEIYRWRVTSSISELQLTKSEIFFPVDRHVNRSKKQDFEPVKKLSYIVFINNFKTSSSFNISNLWLGN